MDYYSFIFLRFAKDLNCITVGGDKDYDTQIFTLRYFYSFYINFLKAENLYNFQIAEKVI